MGEDGIVKMAYAKSPVGKQVKDDQEKDAGIT